MKPRIITRPKIGIAIKLEIIKTKFILLKLIICIGNISICTDRLTDTPSFIVVISYYYF